METTIRINTDLLNNDLLDGIKKLFPHTLVEITIQTADETKYILSNPTYANELNERINDYNTKKSTIDLKAQDLI